MAAAAPFSALPSIPLRQQPADFLPQTNGVSHAPSSMDPTDVVPRGPVDVDLNFYRPPEDGSAPHNFVEKPPAGQPQRNFGDTTKRVHVHDARGHEADFSLDAQAFATLQHQPHNPAIDWTSDASVTQHYYPEVEAVLLAHVPGAQRVLLFDHTIRRARPDAPRAPVTRCHIDQTPKSAAQRVRFHCPEEADALLAGRYRIVNVWRPINGVVESSPLAFADSASVADADMVPVEHRYPDRTGETAAIRHNPDHVWWYWSGVGDDERILLQCFDSKHPMNRVPHTAFTDPRSTANSKPRESIEVRALVFG